jgi:hypothetical protein
MKKLAGIESLVSGVGKTTRKTPFDLGPFVPSAGNSFVTVSPLDSIYLLGRYLRFLGLTSGKLAIFLS